MNDIAPTAPPKVRRPRTLIALALIPAFDVLLLTGGVIAMITMLWQVAIRLPWALLTRRSPEWRRFRLQRAGLYIAVAAASFGLARIDSSIADQRADRVVAAIKAFRTEQGHYPKTLDELVPRHLNAIPAARPLALWQDEFRYSRFEGGTDANPRPPLFLYILFAPMGWKIYDFEANEWRFRD
jgi:hypothetical protein